MIYKKDNSELEKAYRRLIQRRQRNHTVSKYEEFETRYNDLVKRGLITKKGSTLCDIEDMYLLRRRLKQSLRSTAASPLSKNLFILQ